MTVAIAIHLAAAVAAFGIGSVVLLQPKGTPMHKAFGRAWVGLVAVAAISSFWILEIRQGAGFSFIHALSAWTLFAAAVAVLAIRRGRVRTHAGWMIGTFVGLVAAGAGTLAPGRMLPEMLFG